jgi:hypothetical protein
MPQIYPLTSVGCRPCTVHVAGTKGVDPQGVAKCSGPVKVVKCQALRLHEGGGSSSGRRRSGT